MQYIGKMAMEVRKSRKVGSMCAGSKFNFSGLYSCQKVSKFARRRKKDENISISPPHLAVQLNCGGGGCS